MKARSILKLRNAVIGFFLAASWMPAAELQFPNSPRFETRDGRTVVRYSDVATIDGTVIELEAEVLGQTPLGARNRLTTNNGGLVFELEGGNGETRVAKVNYRFFEAGTVNPVVLEAVGLRLKGLVGRADQFCTLQAAEAVGYSLSENSNLVVDDSNGVLVTPNSIQDSNAPVEANEVVLDFGNCHSFTINYGCDFLTVDAAPIEHCGTAGSNASPAGSGSIATGVSTTGMPGMPLYYTYRFNNRSAVSIPVELTDVLQKGVLWDKAFLPTKEGPMVFNVVYDSDRKARIPGLMLPSGQSRITLATKPVTLRSKITNNAYITFTDGTEIAPMNGNPTIDLGSLAGEITSNPFLSAYAAAEGRHYEIFVTGSRFTMGGNNSTILGDSALAEGVAMDFSTGVITGELAVHPPFTGDVGKVADDSGKDALPVVPVEKNLYGAKFVIMQLAEMASKLPPTEIIDIIDHPITIPSSAPDGFNVVQIDGVNMASNDLITLVGSSSDFFVLNIKTNWALGGNTGVVLSGGIPGENVVVNLLPGATGIQLSGQSIMQGTVLAVQEGQLVEVSGGSTIGSVMANDIHITGGSIGGFDETTTAP